MADGETLAGLLEEYATAARTIEETVETLPDLGRTVPLPTTPWSCRRPVPLPMTPYTTAQR